MRYEIPSDVRIGLDVDGVLAGFMNAFVKKAKEMDVDFYEHHTEWGARIPRNATEDPMQASFSKVWDAVDDDFWLNDIQPLEKAYVDFPVAGYFTSRGSVSEGVTETWLEMHGFPSAPVFKVDRSSQKQAHLIEEGIDFYVDDKPSTVIGLQGSDLYDGEAVLMTRPDNLQFTMFDPRIHYLTQLRGLIEKYEQHGYFTDDQTILA